MAAQAGEIEAVCLLLARGADPRAENEKGERPPNLAAKAGHDRVVEALEEAEALRPLGPSFADEPEDFDLHAVTLKGSPSELAEAALAAFDARLGVRLPGEYRGFLKRFNGGVPRPDRFRLPDDGGSGMKYEVKRFLAVGAESSFGEDTDLDATRARLADWGLPRRMLPIASVDDDDDEGGLL
jgi:SMI1-KNR4 cell-wall